MDNGRPIISSALHSRAPTSTPCCIADAPARPPVRPFEPRRHSPWGNGSFGSTGGRADARGSTGSHSLARTTQVLTSKPARAARPCCRRHGRKDRHAGRHSAAQGTSASPVSTLDEAPVPKPAAIQRRHAGRATPRTLKRKMPRRGVSAGHVIQPVCQPEYAETLKKTRTLRNEWALLPASEYPTGGFVPRDDHATMKGVTPSGEIHRATDTCDHSPGPVRPGTTADGLGAFRARG